MAAGDLNIALILKLVDQATGPARAVTNSLRDIGAVTEQTGRAGVAWANEQLAANQARRSALQGEAMGLLALGGSLVALTEPAIQAERRLAEVSKVVSFDAPEGFAHLQSDIRELVTSGGLAATADGVADIIAAAGRMGVVDENLPDDEKRAQLLDFAVAASKMSVAFGISADEAGTTLARWRQNLSLSQEEAMGLGDTVNFLGNTMATNEADILSVINRQGVVAKTAGLAANEIAALSATLLAAGASPEIAATGLKNFTNALTRGESVTSRQREVFNALGLDAEQLAMRMQDDATGGIMSVLEAFQEIEPYRRSSMVGDLFGEEAKGAIMPLIANMGMLQTAFAETADTAKLMGLMEDEYQRQAATTHAGRQRLFEYLKGFSVVVGSTLLPILNELMSTIMPVIAQFTDWAAAHPELIQFLFKAALAIFTFRLASVALRWTLFSILPPFLHIIRAGSWMLALLPRLATGLLALLNPMMLIRGALVAIRLAFLATGIGALIAGVAMAGIWIYNNWEGLRTFFVGFWRTFREALGPAAPMLDGIIEYAKGIWEWFTNILGPMDATEEQWLSWGMSAGDALGGVVGKVVEWTSKNSGLIGTVAKLYGWFFALRLIWRLPMAPIRTAGRVLAWVGKGPMKWLLSGVGLLSKAFIRLGLLMLTNPIGLIIAGVAILAKVVYDNWDKIVSFFIEKVDAVKSAFDEGLLNGVFKLLAEFNPFTLAVEGMQGLVAYVMDLLGVPDEIVAAFREFDLFETGADLLRGLWDGMASLVPQMVSAISEKLSGIVPDWMQDAWNWVTGAEDAPEVSVPALSETAGFTALPEEQQAAVRTIESIAPVLPTEAYQLDLQLREDELRQQIADLQASMTPPPAAFAYVQELQNAQADLAFAQELIAEARSAGDQTEVASLEDEARALTDLIANRQAMIASLTENSTQGQDLARLQGELTAVIERQAQAKAEADALTQALMVINQTEVAPTIDTTSVDEALRKIAQMSAQLSAVSTPRAVNVAGSNPEGARDRGGPVRAGVPYLVGERSPEIFVPGVSGSILPGRVLKAAMAATALAGPAAAMPSEAEIVESVDRRPAISTSAPAPQITRQGDTFHITIAPPPGTDEETIVRLLRRELDRRQDARRADLHDGVDY